MVDHNAILEKAVFAVGNRSAIIACGSGLEVIMSSNSKQATPKLPLAIIPYAGSSITFSLVKRRVIAVMTPPSNTLHGRYRSRSDHVLSPVPYRGDTALLAVFKTPIVTI